MILGLLFPISNMLYMHYYAFFNRYLEDELLAYCFVNNLLMVLFDVTIIVLFFLLVTLGRFKLSLLSAYSITWLWSLVNLFYIRFFGQYIPLSALGMINQLADQAVTNSIFAGLSYSDLYFVISLVLFTFFYRSMENIRFPIRWICGWILLPIVFFASIFVVYSLYHVIKSETRRNKQLYTQRIVEYLHTDTKNAFPNTTRFLAGCVRVLTAEVYEVSHPYVLSNKERDEVFIESSNLKYRKSNHLRNHKVKNVVFLVLESFLSSPIDLIIEGKEITPFLNSLKREEDVYYNGHVQPNITMGESGDGQFIYMTGILPLRDKLTVGEAKNLALPALPRVLKNQLDINYSEIIIPSPPKMWEQEQMNKVYGIKKMYCNRDMLGTVSNYLNDEQVFSMAMKSLSVHHQPFFSIVLSYSTHQPYRTPIDNNFVLNDPSISNGYKNYLIACHYTDHWMEKYINYLKRNNAYENSLIIITADHNAHLDALGMEGKLSKELPLFIIHGNIDVTKAWMGVMNQLDVYTTILDVLDVQSNWYGLGHTILDLNYHNSLTEQAWTMSEWIIKGKYFGLLHNNESDY